MGGDKVEPGESTWPDITPEPELPKVEPGAFTYPEVTPEPEPEPPKAEPEPQAPRKTSR